jgi:hypothetical protein
MCSRCWDAGRPRRSAFADGAATFATERAATVTEPALPHDRDLGRRRGFYLGNAAIRVDEAANADRVALVAAFRRSKTLVAPPVLIISRKPK